MTKPPEKKSRILPWLLVILPLWLAASGVYALWRYFEKEEAAEAEAGQRFSRSVSIAPLADDLNKIVRFIGERNSASPEKLAATSSMIQGLLGPSNTGYQVKTVKTSTDFPILHVTVPSAKREAAPLWILTSYDSPPGSKGAEKNASGLAATLAAAQALANATPGRPIHFLFLPHVNDPESPVIATAAAAAALIGEAPEPAALLCVEAMAAAETLILSSRDTGAPPANKLDGLGEILGAEVVCLGDDHDLASILFEMNLPAVRVATRPTLAPDEEDDMLPFAPTLAASAGRLIELINRLSGE